MAPVSAAERQRKRREKLKAAGNYGEYKAKNAEYSKKYRLKKALDFENLKKEDKSRVLDEERAKARDRQRKSRENKRSKLLVKAPQKSGYSSNQGLSRASWIHHEKVYLTISHC